LLEGNGDFVPIVGSLYSLGYAETQTISPEVRKSRLQEATVKILSALARCAPTVFCLEDLHWADPSFHFSKSQSIQKAVEYLVKSGEKSQQRYSLEEAYEYFKQAFRLLSDKVEKTVEEEKRARQKVYF
jgi:predicted ATPase